MIIKYINEKKAEQNRLTFENEYVVFGLFYFQKFGMKVLLHNDTQEIISVNLSEVIVVDDTPSLFWKIYKQNEEISYIVDPSWMYNIDEVLFGSTSNLEGIYESKKQQKEFINSIHNIYEEAGIEDYLF